LVEVELNENVYTIGTCAFKNCTSLRSIEIPSNVTSIKDDAFQGCTSLSVVELNEAFRTWTVWIYELYISTFYEDTTQESHRHSGWSILWLHVIVASQNEWGPLRTWTIPSTINSIALDAFMGSNLLRNVSISTESNSRTSIWHKKCLSNLSLLCQTWALLLTWLCIDLINYHCTSILMTITHSMKRNNWKASNIKSPGFQHMDSIETVWGWHHFTF